MNFLELDAKAFKAKLALENDACLIDVREQYEFEDSNIGGKNIPMGEVLSSIDSLKDKSNIHLICKSGKRSKAIAYHLSKKLEHSTIYSCTGGLEAYTQVT